ncbi:hypothetical protein Fmac_000026 [Flemingia macrophylla]|uniref:Uncharacterized protein n=1 Tax=Flemingia macrophylla TaxID=520843 RepID=A0ABD1ND60_9FABA
MEAFQSKTSSNKSKWFSLLHKSCDTHLEWKLIYVGSAEDETYDQLLESVLVGLVNVGNYRFVLQASFWNTNLLNFVLPHAIDQHTLVLFGLQADPSRFMKKI